MAPATVSCCFDSATAKRQFPSCEGANWYFEVVTTSVGLPALSETTAPASNSACTLSPSPRKRTELFSVIFSFAPDLSSTRALPSSEVASTSPLRMVSDFGTGTPLKLVALE